MIGKIIEKFKPKKKKTSSPSGLVSFNKLVLRVLKTAAAISSCKDMTEKTRLIEQVNNDINSLPLNNLENLMSNNNEIVKDFASRAFVDKNPDDLMLKLKSFLKDKNTNLRLSAIIAVDYLNSAESLSMLKKVLDDKVLSVRLRAFSSVSDIAWRQNNAEAKAVLISYANDKEERVREFIKEELSLIE